MSYGKRIKEARKEAGLTQQELAERLGISSVNISQFENDKRNPKFETLSKIASAIGISIYELIDLQEVNSDDYIQLIEIDEKIKELNISIPAWRAQGHYEIAAEEEKKRSALLKKRYFIENTLDKESKNAIEKISDIMPVLNDNGKREAVKRIEELSRLSEYRKEEKEVQIDDPLFSTEEKK